MELNSCNHPTAALININDDVEKKKAGAGGGQQSSLSSSVRERRSRESHSKSLTSTSHWHRRHVSSSLDRESSALVDEDGVVCPITPSISPKFVTSSSSNSLPTLSTRESSSVSTSTGDKVVGLSNKDSKYKACPNITLQRHLNESIKVSSTTTMDMDIIYKSDNSNKKRSDLGSSELTLLTSNVQGKGVTRSSEKDERRGGTTFLPTLGAEDKDTRRSPFEDQCKDEGERAAASDWKEGKGIMLCMPVTEVSYFRYSISLLLHMICSLNKYSLFYYLLEPGTAAA